MNENARRALKESRMLRLNVFVLAITICGQIAVGQPESDRFYDQVRETRGPENAQPLLNNWFKARIAKLGTDRDSEKVKKAANDYLASDPSLFWTTRMLLS